MNSMTNPHNYRGIVDVRAQTNTDLPGMISTINAAFEEFKATSQQKQKEIDSKFDDVVTTEKLEKLEAVIGNLQSAVDDANSKIAASKAGAGSGDDTSLDPFEVEYTKTYSHWMRTGSKEDDIKAALKSRKLRAAYEVGSGADGGLLAPVEWDRTITDKRVEVCPMRRFASQQNVTGQGFKKLYNLRGTTSGWVGETEPRPETGTSGFAEYDFSFGEIYANPAATQNILDDAEINLEAWLMAEVNTKFAEQEGIAFVSGDGINKPTGVLSYDQASEDARPAGKKHPLGHVNEVKSGDANTITPEGLLDLIYNLPSDRSDGAAFYANRTTHGVLRKMKDGDGNFLWQPPFQQGQPSMILGNPLYELSGMPNVAANAIPIIYGNMQQAYRIFDRLGLRMLRDPYSNKPFVLFYTMRRVGGGLLNPEWLRYHRIAA